MSKQNDNPYLEDACDKIKKKVMDICNSCEALMVVADDKLGYDMRRSMYVNTAAVFLSVYDKYKLAAKVLEKVYPHWNHIIERDESFFLSEANGIFGEIPADTKLFSELFEKNVLNVKQKQDLWKLFEDLIPLTCVYIHEMREPTKVLIDGVTKGSYKQSFRNDIRIKEHVIKYEVKLRF